MFICTLGSGFSFYSKFCGYSCLSQWSLIKHIRSDQTLYLHCTHYNNFAMEYYWAYDTASPSMLGTSWNAIKMCNLLLIWKEEIFTIWVALLTLRISRVCHPLTALIKRHGRKRRAWGWTTLRWKPSSWPSPRNWPSFRVLLAPVRSLKLIFGRITLKVIFKTVTSICLGKTYVGLKIAQALLNNHNLWREDKAPMLVVCYTNHALDQFLEGKHLSKTWIRTLFKNHLTARRLIFVCF